MTKENKNIQTEILQEVSRFFRRYNMDGSHFIVILYLYFLRSLKIDYEIEERSVREYMKYEIFLSIPESEFPLIHRINQIVSRDLQQWPRTSFRDLVNIFSYFDFKGVDENPGMIFEHLLYAFDNILGKRKSIGILPKGLSEQLFNYLNLPDNPKVYNPFAGFGSLAPNVQYVGYYHGQELNQETWAIGAMRLILNGYKINLDFRREDSISNWPELQKFDLVAAFPPFNFKIFRQYHNIGYAKTAEQLVLHKGLRCLKADGKVLCVVSNGFLFRGGNDEKLRKEIIDNNLLDSILSFPSGLLNNTGIPFSILILNKDKKSDHIYIHDFDAQIENERTTSSFVGGVNKFPDEINWADVFASVKTKSTDYGIQVGKDEIVANDYNLSVPRYFINKDNLQSLQSPKKLDDITEVIQGQSLGGEKFGKFVRIRDLNDEGVNFTLDLKNIKNSKIPKYTKEITESCLLLSLRWNTLKPTLFNYRGRSIYIPNDLIALRLNNDEIDPAYVANELNEAYVLEQFFKLQNAGTHPSINKKDLLKIVIECPEIEEQRAKVKGIFTAYSQAKTKELELQKEILGYQDEAFREFASIRHTFRQYLNALKSNVAGTKKFVRKNQGKPLDPNLIYSKNLNQTFDEHLSSLEDTIRSMSSMLESFDERKEFKRSKEKNDLVKLVKESIKRFRDPEIFRFDELHIDRESFDAGGRYAKPEILFNKEDFFMLFSNIVSNAKEHGFKEKEEGNIIRCAITNDWDEKEFILEISNNGKAFPENFSFKKLITRGEKTTNSSGSGMGGADIHSILKYYSSRFDIYNVITAEFPVTYVLRFPHQYEVIL